MAKSATRKPKGNPKAGRALTLQDALSRAFDLSSRGRLVEALQEFDSAIDRFGPGIELLYNRGVTYQRLGRHQEALQSFSQITETSTRTAPVHFGIGVSHKMLGDNRKALRAYDEAIARFPKYAEALNNRGIIYQELKRWNEAIESHRAAIDAEPTYADAHNNLGSALHGVGRNEEALEALDKALALSPNHREAHNNRAVSLQSLGRLDEALVEYDKSIAAGGSVRDFTNRGNCLAELGRVDEAGRDYNTALGQESAFPIARFNKSVLDLQRGDFAAGWPGYEFRALNVQGDPIPVCSVPGWDGTPALDRTIYVRSEQGAGDAIQFMRYLKFVKERCAKVVFECQKEILPLAMHSEGVDVVVVKEDASRMIAAPADSLEVFLLSLPGIFNTDMDSIPSSARYVPRISPYAEIWRQRILESPELKPGLRVGIVWAGSATHGNDRARSCRLDDFASLADIPNVNLYSLQKGAAASQLHTSKLAGKVVDLQYALLDYGDTAGAIEMMDVVISVDTSVAHLAGAVGKPVWTLLPSNPDWRWLLEREDSPWYPSMRLFRKTNSDDWADVLARVQAALVDHAQTSE